MASLEELLAERARRGGSAEEGGPSLAELEAERERRRVAQEPEDDGRTSIGERVQGVAETLATVGSAAVAEPIAGIAGLATTAFQGPEAGAQAVESTREALQYEPSTPTGQEYVQNVGEALAPVGEAVGAAEEYLGETALEATGSPALAAAAHALPTAALELLGLKGIGKVAKKADDASEAVAAAKAIDESPRTPPPVMDTEAKTYDEIVDAAKARDEKALAMEVKPDEEILAAAEQLGVDLNPSHYSTNESFVRMEQALKAVPESELEVKEIEALAKLGQEADELVAAYAGTLDRGAIDFEVQRLMTEKEAAIGAEVGKMYSEVKDAIPATTKVDMDVSRRYIDNRLEELGGDVSGLSGVEMQLYKVLNPKVKKGETALPPTYARLDQLRKDIGAGYKRQGPFKDDAQRSLDAVYGVLSQDQQGVAKAFGVGPLYETARKANVSRKQLQESMGNLFGRDLSTSLVRKMTSAAGGLTKGDVRIFKAMMDDIPPEMHLPVATGIVQDLFQAGARSATGLGQGFANAYRALDRYPSMKAELFKYLPTEAAERFDAIGKVNQAIYRAKRFENKSRTSNSLLARLESGELVNRLYGGAQAAAMAVPTMVGQAVAQTGINMAKRASDRARAVDKLLASTRFQKVLNLAMEGRVKEAETMLKRTDAWKRFKRTLGDGESAAQLAALGPIAWMTQQEDERRVQ